MVIHKLGLFLEYYNICKWKMASHNLQLSALFEQRVLHIHKFKSILVQFLSTLETCVETWYIKLIFFLFEQRTSLQQSKTNKKASLFPILVTVTITTSFCLFSSFSHFNFNNANWKKRRLCAWDSNPRPQNSRHMRYHYELWQPSTNSSEFCIKKPRKSSSCLSTR